MLCFVVVSKMDRVCLSDAVLGTDCMHECNPSCHAGVSKIRQICQKFRFTCFCLERGSQPSSLTTTKVDCSGKFRAGFFRLLWSVPV
jgi:hypothetical protein